MGNSKAIESLKRELKKISKLRTLPPDNKEFESWRHRVLDIIEAAFGKDSSEYRRLPIMPIQTLTFQQTEAQQKQEYNELLDKHEIALKSIIKRQEILERIATKNQPIRPQFSNPTLSYIIDILADRTDSQLGHFFFKYGLLHIYEQYRRPTAKKTKVRDVFQHLITAGDESALDTLGLMVREVLKEDVYKWLESRRGGWESFSQVFPDLERALSADGFQVHEGELIPVISPTVEPAKEEGLVERLLDEYGFNVAKNHLEQAFDNYLDGTWEASNGALRSFLQDVFDQIALKLWPEEAAKKEAGGARRKLLQEKGFIKEDTEAGLVRSFFKFAHGEGSHPGISNESDCRLRRYIAVALASYYLEKLGVKLETI